MNWYIINVRSGRELFLHELFDSNGYEIYTPFETKFQRPVSRKARTERKPPVAYAEPLFKGYLFVGGSMGVGQALAGIGYIIDRREDAYSFMIDRGEAFVMSDDMMQKWQNLLTQAHSGKSRYVIRGYDPRRDGKKNQSRLYGQEAITIPTFTKGEKVKFMSGGFQSLGAEISASEHGKIDVLMTIFGSVREIKDVDPYELRKVG